MVPTKRLSCWLTHLWLEYASTLWDPYQHNLIDNLEMIQRRCARFVLNRYGRTDSVSEMLQILKWQTLEERRRNARLKMFYNIYNNYIPTQELKSVLQAPHYISKNDHHSKVRLISAKHKVFQNSFFPKTICDWNKLPLELINSNNIRIFNNRLSKIKVL